MRGDGVDNGCRLAASIDNSWARADEVSLVPGGNGIQLKVTTFLLLGVEKRSLQETGCHHAFATSLSGLVF